MKIKFIPSILLSSILFSSCGGSTNGVKQAITTNKQNQTNQSSTSYEENWLTLYDKIEPTEIPENPIDLISNDWMLITAGKQKSYNTMTAAWGGIWICLGKTINYHFC